MYEHYLLRGGIWGKSVEIMRDILQMHIHSHTHTHEHTHITYTYTRINIL